MKILILTHPGPEHLDDCACLVLAEYVVEGSEDCIASFRCACDPNSEPVKNLIKNFKPQEIWVIDQGQRFLPDGEMVDGILWRYFDHHFQGGAPSAFSPFCDWICQKYGVEVDFSAMKEICDFADTGMKDNELAAKILKSFSILNNIGSFDAGKNVAKTMEYYIGYDSVLDAFAAVQIKAAFEKHKEYKENLELIKQATKDRNIICLPRVIYEWKEMVEDEIVFCVSPSQRGGYNLVTKLEELPPTPSATFRHQSGFLANYVSQEDAVKDLSPYMTKFVTIPQEV